MKKWLGITIGLAGAVIATARGQAPVRQLSEFVPGEVLVQYRRASTPVRRNAIVAGRRARLVRRFDEVDVDHLQLQNGEDLAAALEAFRSQQDVVSVSANYVRHAVATTPNDTRWSEMWGLQRIQMPAAWDIARGDGSVVIMDIDTGINYNHPDLSANVWTNPNEIANNNVDDDGDGYKDDVHGINVVPAVPTGNPLDDNGHGTHTAGTLAAVGNNATGVVGVNWNAKVISCKFLDSGGSGTDAGAIQCLNYAVYLRNHGVNIRVTNNSWGGARGGSDPTPLKNAFNAAGNAGIISFVAAGNGDVNNIGYNLDIAGNEFDPASLSVNTPSIVAVASSDGGDSRSGFSNFGPNTVALAAPGVSILSTYGNSYQYLGGTSMATPHVAGVAALLSSISPSLTVNQLKAVITNNVDVLASWGGVVTTGGRLNAFLAVSAVASPPVQYTLTPTPTTLNTASPLTIGWTAPANHAGTDWLGLYRVGDPNTAYVWWSYTGSATSGSFNLTSPSQAGQYEFRYLLNNGYQDSARSAAVTVNQSQQTGTYTLTPSPLSVAAGGALTINWTAPGGRPASDWIGLYRQSGGSYVWWSYTGGATSGSINLTAPSTPDTYVFHYFLQDGFTEATVSPAVTVTGAQQPAITISASPGSIAPGGLLTASWTAPAGRPATDWIGLYRVGTPNTSYLWWQYTSGSQSGSAHVNAPSPNGQYEFRYLTQDSYNLAATSNAISVTGSAVESRQPPPPRAPVPMPLNERRRQ